MADTLKRCLDDLESRLDEKVETQLYTQWVEFTENQSKSEVFEPRRLQRSVPRVEWPKVLINDTLENTELMALREYKTCSDLLENGEGYLLCVRSNYGTGIISSLFGAELFLLDKELDTLPTVKPLGDNKKIRDLVDKGVPDLDAGFGAKVMDMGRFFRDVAQRYPKIGKFVYQYHPDLQGPMDSADLVWGSDIFLAIYDEPDLLDSFLGLMTDTYIKFMKKWQESFQPAGPYTFHWGFMQKGSLMIREDSCTNLSPDNYARFIKPYDQTLLDIFNGGCLHFCGKGDHMIGQYSSLSGLYGINMTQPEYNDMEVIYKNTVDKGIKLLNFKTDAARLSQEQGRPLRGQVHI